ncbi:hypothetical protein LCGC14_0363640 [marine sediment metagenome]|uniref:Uncharacterized protein n=1 Tax=marine sediment metagenome TaxID=412755 RepID=A0A0F9TQC9_9ZZZZ
MRYAHITPLRNFKLSDTYNDMHLLLYHWGLKSEKYSRKCRQSKVYKMADNSQYELRKEIDYDDYLRWAQWVKADEIIAPDVMYNFKKTKKLIEDFIPRVPKQIAGHKVKIQGVVCGKTIEELKRCYDWLCNNEGIDVIGISKHGCVPYKKEDYFQSRRDFLESVFGTEKPIHLLGVNDFKDFLTDIPTLNVRSIDGKFLAKVANFDKKIDLHTHINRNHLLSLFNLFEHIK